MSRVSSVIFRVAVAAIFLGGGGTRMKAQTATPPPQAEKPATAAPAQAPAKEPEEEGNPFAPQPAPPLPPGMTGADVNDPRFKLAPGMYDAGEASMGIKHLIL